MLRAQGAACMRCTPQRLAPAAGAVAHTPRARCMGEMRHTCACILQCPTVPPSASSLVCCTPCRAPAAAAGAARGRATSMHHVRAGLGRRLGLSLPRCTRSPTLAAASLFAPAAIRAVTTSARPSCAEMKRGVWPSCRHACARRRENGVVEAAQPSLVGASSLRAPAVAAVAHTPRAGPSAWAR